MVFALLWDVIIEHHFQTIRVKSIIRKHAMDEAMMELIIIAQIHVRIIIIIMMMIYVTQYHVKKENHFQTIHAKSQNQNYVMDEVMMKDLVIIAHPHVQNFIRLMIIYV
jgi:hypothetical protein